MTQAWTPPHNPCRECGKCCYQFAVPLSGYDVWLISTRQRLAPEQFVVPLVHPLPQPDGFQLSADGEWLYLALDKRGKKMGLGKPCVFLLQLPGGNDRCGIYADRPAICRAYPMSLKDAQIVLSDHAICPPGSWPEFAVRRPGWRPALRRHRMQFDVYYAVLARWNARVAQYPGQRFTLGEFFAYLMNVYQQVDQVESSLGEARMALVRNAWGERPEPGSGSTDWAEYLLLCRQIVDRFYPEVALADVRLPRLPSPPVATLRGTG